MTGVQTCALPISSSWVVERRVFRTQQVSQVGRVPPGPVPLSYQDSSSALSPWTSYQYRLLAQTQAGTGTGPWSSVTTRPSRPAGLSPPRVLVLGPDSLEVGGEGWRWDKGGEKVERGCYEKC